MMNLFIPLQAGPNDELRALGLFGRRGRDAALSIPEAPPEDTQWHRNDQLAL